MFANPKLVLDTTNPIEPTEVIWRSPSNIALVKYWGKYGEQLPKNPSISLTLSAAFTEMQMVATTKEVQHAGIL